MVLRLACQPAAVVCSPRNQLKKANTGMGVPMVCSSRSSRDVESYVWPPVCKRAWPGAQSIFAKTLPSGLNRSSSPCLASPCNSKAAENDCAAWSSTCSARRPLQLVRSASACAGRVGGCVQADRTTKKSTQAMRCMGAGMRARRQVFAKRAISAPLPGA